MPSCIMVQLALIANVRPSCSAEQSTRVCLYLADGGDDAVHDLSFVRPQHQAGIVDIEECCAQALTDCPFAYIPHARHAYEEAVLSRACPLNLHRIDFQAPKNDWTLQVKLCRGTQGVWMSTSECSFCSRTSRKRGPKKQGCSSISRSSSTRYIMGEPL